ncbi:extensin [Iris pallida]|uniref:Extensin n=1 Tax=Iris pallida TaxID=29817 RepID=A0AAX6EVP5_IRIPA|nr:extensin [Iris pallida]
MTCAEKGSERGKPLFLSLSLSGFLLLNGHMFHQFSKSHPCDRLGISKSHLTLYFSRRHPTWPIEKSRGHSTLRI